MKENSIKEDINYLNSMVKEYKQFGNLYNEEYEDEDRIYQALEHILSDYKRVLNENKVLLKENEELKFKERSRIIGEYGYTEIHDVINKTLSNDYISVQKVKDIIDRIDYDIKKTKEIISNYRRNDYQITRLKAMNTKSLDIKKRLQELLESEE